MDANGNDVKNVGGFSSVESELQRIPTPIVRLETSDSTTDINVGTLFPWGTAELIDTGTYSYTAGNPYLSVDEAGTYEVQVTIGINSTSNSQPRDNPNAELFKNRTSSGAGGTRLKAAGRTGYVRQDTGHGLSSLHLSWLGELTAGDTLAIQMFQEANDGTRTCRTQDTNMYVKKIARP